MGGPFASVAFPPPILDTASGRRYVPNTGDVAQLGERRLRKSEVVGSNPIISIAKPFNYGGLLIAAALCTQNASISTLSVAGFLG